MAISVLRLLGERVAHKTLAQHSHTGGFLDIKLGFSMLKDRRVPFRPKLLAIGLGAGLIALLIGLEFPLEALLALVPGVGLLLDVMTDAMEAVIGTVGVAAILLPHLAPKLLTQQIRNERAGIIEATFVSEPPIVEPMRSSYDLPQPTQKLISPQT
ncbi:MAG: hypothetical protein JWL77_4952 [Chthonomonadaceae bacterium]|nr:hypothetical protein [Chthonomonadaceae bacterium]